MTEPKIEAESGSRDEDTALAVAAKQGDTAARERLIMRLIPLIRAIGRSFRVEGLEFADIVQEGAVGVLRALERYDASLGTPFGQYAAIWIRQSLQELRSDFMRPLRLPPRALRELAQLKSEHARFWAAQHREPTLAELSKQAGVGRDQVDALIRADRDARLLSEPVIGIEGEIGLLGDMVEDPVALDRYEEVLDSIAGDQARELLGRLNEREREIVDARFGFRDAQPERLVEIGERLGLSAERVRQIEQRAISKMRRAD